MQLIGECVGLVMAPVIFYYLYYQVSTPCIIFVCQCSTGPACIIPNSQPHAVCVGLAVCLLHAAWLLLLAVFASCCSAAVL